MRSARTAPRRWPRLSILLALGATAAVSCDSPGGEDAGVMDAGPRPDAGPERDAGPGPDGSPDEDAGPVGTDAGPSYDGGPPIGDCVPERLADGMIRICVDFPTGVRAHLVPPVEDSFGTHDPPADNEFSDPHTPGAGECSERTHDRYWVRGRDGRIYRTWHPASGVDVETREPCNFGHEHGDDPRTSPLYLWAGGVPFGIVNHAAVLAGFHRHEDHYGHKVVVQNLWEAAVGNTPGPDDEPVIAAGFHCYWLSKVHQGTHSGDALGSNMHEYQNSVMCDDGAVRQPDPGRDVNTGPTHHTENSVKTLTFWGQPGWFKGCDGLERIDVPTGMGFEPPASSDTNREIKCARASQGWMFKDHPQPVTSATGHTDFAPRDAGIDELWKPWMTVTSRDGDTLFTSSAYYVVRNPIRVYNDGSLIAQRDVDGDGAMDNWIPTLEVCLGLPDNDRFGQCADLPTFPTSVPMTEWWRLPESPFNGTVRVIHPKRIDVINRSARSEFCTDYLGQETDADPTPDARGYPTCPAGQIYQRVAATQNLWVTGAGWGADGSLRGDISGSRVNARGPTMGAGYGHEWVRFFDAPGIHAPN